VESIWITMAAACFWAIFEIAFRYMQYVKLETAHWLPSTWSLRPIFTGASLWALIIGGASHSAWMVVLAWVFWAMTALLAEWALRRFPLLSSLQPDQRNHQGK
jgi:hypothetical protein